MSGTIRIDEGEDYIAKFQRWQSKKWYKRIGLAQWLLILGFFTVATVVVVVGGLWLVDYVAVNGFDFNPIPAPNRLRG
jgi:hypothetical protein